MVAEDFVASKRAGWERLETLLARIRRGRLSGLQPKELYELGRLYRQTTSDLAVARRDWPTHRVVEYLNGLVARAHAEVYRNDAATWRRLRDFVLVRFPEVWRRTFVFTLVAFLCFALPALLAFAVAVRDPSQSSLLFPDADRLVDEIKAHHEWWRDINQGRGSSAALIMSNNILISVKAFAGGVLLGLYALYLLIFNGLMLGTIAGLSLFYGFSSRLWTFIAPHAPLELSVIFFSGGAGLQMGYAILHPGLLTRGAALRQAAERAVVIMIGCIPLLAIAGAIEAFVSPSDLPIWTKLLVSVATGMALYAYLLGAGRPAVARQVHASEVSPLLLPRGRRSR